jgi:hypothetical protein
MQPCRVAASVLTISMALCLSEAAFAGGRGGSAPAAAPSGASAPASAARPAITIPYALPLIGAPGVFLREGRGADQLIFGGADDPPWAGQLTARERRRLARAEPPQYWREKELPETLLPGQPPPFAPPTFQIIGAPSSSNMQAPVRLTHGVTAPPRTNPEPRIIWLDRRGNVVADNGKVSDPHVRYIK